MNPQIWSDVSVAVQTALASAITAITVTKGSPTSFAKTAHGLDDGDYVLLRCVGINDLDYLVGKVVVPDASTFTIAFDSTDSKGTATSCTAQQVTLGAEFATLQEISPSGGEAEDVQIRTIHTSQDRSLPGNQSPLVFSFTSIRDPADPGLVECKKASRTRTVRAVRYGFADGSEMLFAGRPSTSLAPGGSAANLVTTPLKINVVGQLLDLLAA